MISAQILDVLLRVTNHTLSEEAVLRLRYCRYYMYQLALHVSLMLYLSHCMCSAWLVLLTAMLAQTYLLSARKVCVLSHSGVE